MSVVVPCYNYGHYLPDCVNSVLSQNGVDLEIIIVDDCSTDDSVTVAKTLATEHPQVRLIQNPVNLRHIATYNVGLAEATGDYVVLLSADDMLAPGSLTRSTALFEAHPEVVLVYGRALSFTSSPPSNLPPVRSWSTWRGEDWLARACRRSDNLVVNPEVILRRSVLERFGGYDRQFPHAADMLLWLQAATVGDVGRVNGVQAFYRDHPANMHKTDYAGTLNDMRERAAVFAAFLGPGGAVADPRRAASLLEASRQSMAREALRYALYAIDSTGEVGGSNPAAFVEFALESWPEVRHTHLWAALRSREARMVAPWRSAAARSAFTLRWKLRWRRQQRWGT